MTQIYLDKVRQVAKEFNLPFNFTYMLCMSQFIFVKKKIVERDPKPIFIANFGTFKTKKIPEKAHKIIVDAIKEKQSDGV